MIAESSSRLVSEILWRSDPLGISVVISWGLSLTKGFSMIVGQRIWWTLFSLRFFFGSNFGGGVIVLATRGSRFCGLVVSRLKISPPMMSTSKMCRAAETVQ